MANQEPIGTKVFATREEADELARLWEVASTTPVMWVGYDMSARAWEQVHEYMEQIAVKHGLPWFPERYALNTETMEFLDMLGAAAQPETVEAEVSLVSKLAASIGAAIDSVLGRVNPVVYLVIGGAGILLGQFGPNNQAKLVGWYAIYGLLGFLLNVIVVAMACDIPNERGRQDSWKSFLFEGIITAATLGIDTHVVRVLLGAERFYINPVGWFATFLTGAMWSVAGFYALLLVVNLYPVIRNKFTGGINLLATI